MPPCHQPASQPRRPQPTPNSPHLCRQRRALLGHRRKLRLPGAQLLGRLPQLLGGGQRARRLFGAPLGCLLVSGHARQPGLQGSNLLLHHVEAEQAWQRSARLAQPPPLPGKCFLGGYTGRELCRLGSLAKQGEVRAGRHAGIKG